MLVNIHTDLLGYESHVAIVHLYGTMVNQLHLLTGTELNQTPGILTVHGLGCPRSITYNLC